MDTKLFQILIDNDSEYQLETIGEEISDRTVIRISNFIYTAVKYF